MKHISTKELINQLRHHFTVHRSLTTQDVKEMIKEIKNRKNDK